MTAYPECDMSCHALIETIFPKDAECSGESAF